MTVKKSKKSHSKTIILLENEKQVREYISRFDITNEKIQIIALSPFAMYELDKNKLSYNIIEDYYEPEELYTLGIENYSRVEKICDLIDSQIQKTFPEMKELRIRPTLFSFYILKILYDSVTIRLFQLCKLIESEKPSTVVVYHTKRSPLDPKIGKWNLYLNDLESIYSQLIELEGWNLEIRIISDSYVQEISEIENINFKNKIKKILYKYINKNPIIYELAVAFKKGGLKIFIRKFKDIVLPLGNFPVLLYGGGYNWDYSFEDLKKAGIGPIIRVLHDQPRWLSSVSSDEKELLSDVWNNLKNNTEFREFFTWNDLDFFPIIEERLKFIVEYVTPACLRAYEEAESIIKKKKIKVLLASTFNSCFGHSFSCAARKAGIPVILWQHGNYGYIEQPMVVYNDVISSDILLVFGEGVSKKYVADAKRYDTKLIPVGSAALDSLKRIIQGKREKKMVLYVTTHLYQNNLYISFYPPFSDNQFWSTQRTILETLGKHGNYDVVVKLHPFLLKRDPPVREYVEEREFKNIKIIKDECRFIDLIPLANIIVIDFPSTTLLQSLTTTKPIFVYIGHVHIDKKAIEMLKKRAYCYDDLVELNDDLNKFLSGNDIGWVDYNNTEFLEYYGTYKNDGKSVYRAVKILKKVIEEYDRDIA